MDHLRLCVSNITLSSHTSQRRNRALVHAYKSLCRFCFEYSLSHFKGHSPRARRCVMVRNNKSQSPLTQQSLLGMRLCENAYMYFQEFRNVIKAYKCTVDHSCSALGPGHCLLGDERTVGIGLLGMASRSRPPNFHIAYLEAASDVPAQHTRRVRREPKHRTGLGESLLRIPSSLPSICSRQYSVVCPCEWRCGNKLLSDGKGQAW